MPLGDVRSTVGEGVTLSVFVSPGVNSAPPGWEQPAFDDSAWTATVLQPGVSFPSDPPGILGPPADPIAPSDHGSTAAQVWLFRQTFSFAAPQAYATIRVRASFHADDIYWNGTRIGEATVQHYGGGFGGDETFDVAALTTAGDNVLAIFNTDATEQWLQFVLLHSDVALRQRSRSYLLA